MTAGTATTTTVLTINETTAIATITIGAPSTIAAAERAVATATTFFIVDGNWERTRDTPETGSPGEAGSLPAYFRRWTRIARPSALLRKNEPSTPGRIVTFSWGLTERRLASDCSQIWPLSSSTAEIRGRRGMTFTIVATIAAEGAGCARCAPSLTLCPTSLPTTWAGAGLTDEIADAGSWVCFGEARSSAAWRAATWRSKQARRAAGSLVRAQASNASCSCALPTLDTNAIAAPAALRPIRTENLERLPTDLQ